MVNLQYMKSWLGDIGDGVQDGSVNDPRLGVLSIKTRTITCCLRESQDPAKLAKCVMMELDEDAVNHARQEHIDKESK